MDTDIGEESRNFEFLVRVQRDPRGLFTVPEGGVKNPNFFSTQRFDVIENDPTQIALAS